MSERLGVGVAILSSALGGAAAVATRYLIGSADPFTLAALRFGGGVICLLPLALVLRVRWPGRGDRLAVAGLGFMFFAVFFVFYNLALVYTTVARGTLALSTLPLMTMVVGAVLGIEALSARKTAGVLLAMLGVAAALASEASGQRGNLFEVRAPDTLPEPGSSARAALASEASGQRGNLFEVRAHSASEDARERANDTLPEPGSSARAALASGLTDAPAGAWRGDLVMAGATLCMALYNVWSRPFIQRSSALGFLTAGMAVGATALVVVSAFSGDLARVGNFAPGDWLAAIYLAAGGGALAFFLWVYALQHASPTRVANTMTVNPIVAGLLAALLLGEPVTLPLVAGLMAVFAGLWIATTERTPSAPTPRAGTCRADS